MSKKSCLAASKELNRYISDKLMRHLTSKDDLAPRIYAFAALARCNRLLTGMIALHEAGYDDLASINMRPIVECWFLGTYLLLAPDEALNTLLLLQRVQVERLSKGGWEGLTEFIEEIDELEIDGKAHNLKWIASRVDELLAESGEDMYAKSEQVYDSLYRGGSHFDIHAGVGTLQGHIETHGDTTFSIEVRRGEAYEMDHTKPAAGLVGLFALMIAERIMYRDSELARLYAQVLSCGDPR